MTADDIKSFLDQVRSDIAVWQDNDLKLDPSDAQAMNEIERLAIAGLSYVDGRNAIIEECAAICDQQAQAWRDAHKEGSEILAYEDQALNGVANLIRTLKRSAD